MNVQSAFTIKSTLHDEKKTEDCVLIRDNFCLYAVMDGVSGHGDGDKASLFVTSALSRKRPLDVSKIKQLIQKIDEDLFVQNQKDGTDALTTLSLLKLMENAAFIVNIGDSRVYRYRGGRLEQMTSDDNLLSLKEDLKGEEKVFLSSLSDERREEIREKLDEVENPDDLNEEERWFWDNRGVITNSLGRGKAEVRVIETDAKSGDIWALVTDGVSDNLTTKQIKEIIQEKRDSAATLAETLVSRAVEVSKSNAFRSKHDDITALVVKLKPI